MNQLDNFGSLSTAGPLRTSAVNRSLRWIATSPATSPPYQGRGMVDDDTGTFNATYMLMRDTYMLMRDAEGRKKEASKAIQTAQCKAKQKTQSKETQHTQGSHLPKETCTNIITYNSSDMICPAITIGYPNTL